MLCELGPDTLTALKGAVVVLPAVTYANVGELAVDVLVATLKPQSLGAVESVNVLPVVGNDAYDLDPSPSSQQPGRLTTALELFTIPGRPLVFLQQRAPALLGRQSAFAAELVDWLAGAGAAAVLMLTGLDAQLRKDRQLDSSALRYLASSERLRAVCAAAQPPQSADAASFAGPIAAAPLELEAEVREEELQLHPSLPPWPLVRQCEAAGLPYVLLGCFSAEGDNAGEGLHLAGLALQVLAGIRAPAGELGRDGLDGEGVNGGAEPLVAGLEGGAVPPLRAPPSWVGLYGRSFPVEIF